MSEVALRELAKNRRSFAIELKADGPTPELVLCQLDILQMGAGHHGFSKRIFKFQKAVFPMVQWPPGIEDARQFHDDALISLTLNHRLGHTERVDAPFDDPDGLFDGFHVDGVPPVSCPSKTDLNTALEIKSQPHGHRLDHQAGGHRNGCDEQHPDGVGSLQNAHPPCKSSKQLAQLYDAMQKHVNSTGMRRLPLFGGPIS